LTTINPAVQGFLGRRPSKSPLASWRILSPAKLEIIPGKLHLVNSLQGNKQRM